MNGPKNAPRPSPVLQTVFAATSSPGLRAIAGISVTWVGRTGRTGGGGDRREDEERDHRDLVVGHRRAGRR